MRQPHELERLYVDFDSFFASAEQHLQPHLRGRPMGVIPIRSEHTGLIAVSREAKALGVRQGTTVREARRIHPRMVFVTARHDVYVRLHGEILAAIETVLRRRVLSAAWAVPVVQPAEAHPAPGALGGAYLELERLVDDPARWITGDPPLADQRASW